MDVLWLQKEQEMQLLRQQEQRQQVRACLLAIDCGTPTLSLAITCVQAIAMQQQQKLLPQQHQQQQHVSSDADMRAELEYLRVENVKLKVRGLVVCVESTITAEVELISEYWSLYSRARAGRA